MQKSGFLTSEKPDSMLLQSNGCSFGPGVAPTTLSHLIVPPHMPPTSWPHVPITSIEPPFSQLLRPETQAPSSPLLLCSPHLIHQQLLPALLREYIWNPITCPHRWASRLRLSEHQLPWSLLLPLLLHSLHSE